MKKLLALLLAFSVILGAALPVSARGKFVESRLYFYKDYTYFYRDNDIQLMDYYGTASRVKVPSKVNGKKVVALGYSGESQYHDGDYDALWHFGFWDNEYVEEIIVPDSVKIIGAQCFGECRNLKKVKIGNGVKRIYGDDFLRSDRLATIELGTGVKGISNRELFPKGVKAVNVDKRNKYLCSKNGVVFDKNKTKPVFYPPALKSGVYKLPKTVKNLNMSVFDENTYLKSLILPKGLKSVKNNGWFSETVSLKSVTFTGNKVKIGKHAVGFYSSTEKKNGKYRVVYKKLPGFTIKGKVNSSAHKYALKYGLNFKAL